MRSSATSVSTGFRQIHTRHLGESVPGPRGNTKIASAPAFSGSRSGDEVPKLGDAYLGAWCAEEALADVRNGPDPVLPDSVRVDRDVEFDAGRPDILRKRRERGFEQVSWDAGTGPTSLGGRGLGAGEELGVPDPAGPDPFRDPVSKPVGFDRVELVVCSFHRVASGSALR